MLLKPNKNDAIKLLDLSIQQWGYASIDKVVVDSLNIDVYPLSKKFGMILSEGTSAWFFISRHATVEFGHSLTKKEIKDKINYDKKHIR